MQRLGGLDHLYKGKSMIGSAYGLKEDERRRIAKLVGFTGLRHIGEFSQDCLDMLRDYPVFE